MTVRNVDLDMALGLDRRRTEALAKAVGLLTDLKEGEGVADCQVEELLTDCIVALGIEDREDINGCAEDLVAHPEEGMLAERLFEQAAAIADAYVCGLRPGSEERLRGHEEARRDIASRLRSIVGEPQ